MPPLVSVIIPAYNADAYISEALLSVLAQSEKRLEIIVVDDASTDSTSDVVRDIMMQIDGSTPTLRLIRNEENLGPSRSRNMAIREAQAPWIALLDADDRYCPERIERLLNEAERHDADLVADDIYFRPNGSQVQVDRGTCVDRYGDVRPMHRLFASTVRPLTLTPETFVGGALPGGNDPRIALVKPLIRRSFLSEHNLQYPPDVTQGEDYVLYLDCLGHGARFVVLDGPPSYLYRMHPDQTSRQDPLAAQRQRLAVNAELLKRPYASNRPALLHLLADRHRMLSEDVRAYAFAEAFTTSSLGRKVWLSSSRPQQFASFLSDRLVRHVFRLYHRAERLGRRMFSQREWARPRTDEGESPSANRARTYKQTASA